MSETEIRALQERLKAAGYDVVVDGRMGPMTRTALERYNASQAVVASKEADARAEESRAAAEKAKADAARAKADAERSAAEAAERQRADQRSADDAKRQFDMAVTAGAYGAGVVSGALTAKKLDRLHAEGQTAKNKALKVAAREAALLIDKAGGKAPAGRSAAAKLDAIVRTADKAGLTDTRRGSAGPVAGAGLVLVGLASRAIAAKTENETVKTVLNATGTAEVVAGGVVVVKDMANRAASTHLPDVKALGTIEQARAVARPGMPGEPTARPAAGPKATTGGGSLLGAAKRLVLPLIAGVAGYTAFSKSAAAGEHTGKALGDGAKAAAEATADVLTGGAVSTFEATKDAGASTGMATTEAVITGVANLATLGLAGLAADMISRRPTIPYAPESVARRRAGKAYLDAAAAEKAAAPAVMPVAVVGPGGRPASAGMPASDGQTEGYTRVDPRTGMTVQVQGYRTPKK